jgi:cob(I)alamin adenosyltransferase
MKIYTGRGDAGETDLHTGDRVSKASPRIEAYGTVDELNASLGRAAGLLRTAHREEIGGMQDLVDDVVELQHLLFVAQADLANPDKDDDAPTIDDEDVAWCEDRIDAYEEELPPLESFVLPGGAPTGAALHRARTVARRAERRTVALADSVDAEGGDAGEGADGTEDVLAFLNRVSDLLFVLARTANDRLDVEEEVPRY